MQKPCSYCKQRKAMGEFGIKHSHADGRNSVCKVCMREKARVDRIRQKVWLNQYKKVRV